MFYEHIKYLIWNLFAYIIKRLQENNSPIDRIKWTRCV